MPRKARKRSSVMQVLYSWKVLNLDGLFRMIKQAMRFLIYLKNIIKTQCNTTHFTASCRYSYDDYPLLAALLSATVDTCVIMLRETLFFLLCGKLSSVSFFTLKSCLFAWFCYELLLFL